LRIPPNVRFMRDRRCDSVYPEAVRSNGGEMISREELYDLVWSQPMTKVGEKFKLSGSYMARVCATLRVPRPERGYWAKLAVGKAPQKPALPDAQPGDQLSWSVVKEPISRHENWQLVVMRHAQHRFEQLPAAHDQTVLV
jgi:hypothetical protein